ncbi:hypothetical protein [Rhodococcus sp. NPDC059234]|uniref:hypothetical protein n=1 Tax=Rhodococcus sp. NPDC059234 TaxID=3346781 RepID=UPI003671999E
MRRGPWAEDAERLAAVSDSGIVRVSKLESLGVARSTIAARCRPGGPWSRPLPGIVQLSNGRPTERQRAVAALMYCGERALLTGRAALREHGFGQHDGEVHVLLPDRRRVQAKAFVRVERTTRLPEAAMRNGLPCAPLVRALLDAARLSTTLDRARALISEVVQRGGVTARELAEELGSGSVRGSAFPRIVIEEMTANVHSVPEALARELWLKSGLPEMAFNRDIVRSDGTFLARPDGWIDSVALAWEIDSLDWHLSPEQYGQTLERRTRMQDEGIVVLASRPRTVRHDPGGVIRSLRAHYAQAVARPRPSVRMVEPPDEPA